MTFCEYIERISPEPISDFQKKWLNIMEGYARSGCEISIPPRAGKILNIQTILAFHEWKKKYMVEDSK